MCDPPCSSDLYTICHDDGMEITWHKPMAAARDRRGPGTTDTETLLKDTLKHTVTVYKGDR